MFRAADHTITSGNREVISPGFLSCNLSTFLVYGGTLQLGDGTYNCAEAAFAPGTTVTLSGGQLTLPRDVRNVTLNLSGIVSGFNASNCTINLTGNLAVTGACSVSGPRGSGSSLNLGGYNITFGNYFYLGVYAAINLEFGSVTTSGTGYRLAGAVNGTGSINGVFYGFD